MKILFPFTSFAIAAAAQGLTIGTPQQGERVPLERPFTVRVIKNPDTVFAPLALFYDA